MLSSFRCVTQLVVTSAIVAVPMGPLPAASASAASVTVQSATRQGVSASMHYYTTAVSRACWGTTYRMANDWVSTGTGAREYASTWVNAASWSAAGSVPAANRIIHARIWLQVTYHNKRSATLGSRNYSPAATKSSGGFNGHSYNVGISEVAYVYADLKRTNGQVCRITKIVPFYP